MVLLGELVPATLNTGRKDNESGGAGTSTAGIIAGGNKDQLCRNRNWNGSAWSEQNDLNTARTGFALSGGQPAALIWVEVLY